MSIATQTVLPSRHPIAHPAGGRTALYLVRHGRTEGNVRQLLCGHTDVPLDRLGLAQAECVADHISAAISADVIVTSPLQRARRTAEAIGTRIDLDPIVVPGLIEMNFGVCEGVSFESALHDYPDIAQRFADWNDDDVAWPGGEVRRDFHARVYETFLSILHDYHDHRVIVVAHGGVFGSLLAQIQGISPNDWTAYQIKNCSVTHLDVDLEDTTIHLLNNVEHLNGLDELRLDGDAA